MERIHVQEVVTRDGLQNEDKFVETADKIALIDQISEAGVSKVEVTSFVSPKAVPNLKDAEAVMKGIERNPDITYAVLVPNLKGAERAVACDADEINFLVSASETHNMKNVKRTVAETFEGFKEMTHFLKDYDVKLHGALGTSFGCPFEGEVSHERIFSLIEKYVDLGVEGITLADTTGMANPKQVYELCSRVRERWPHLVITLHFHNTRGMGLANVLAGIKAGVIRFDSSLGGLGGCPFAPGATGNICTEDLVHMLMAMGYETNVDLDRLIDSTKLLEDVVGHDVPGQIVKAGKSTDLHDPSVI